MEIINQRLQERIVLTIFVIVSLQSTYSYYIGIGVLPKFILYLNLVAVLSLPFIIALNNKSVIFTPYRYYFLVVFFYLLGITIIYSTLYNNRAEYFANSAIYFQILLGLLMAKYNINFFLKLFLIISYISFAGFLFIVLTTEINMFSAIRRGYQWTEIFFYARLFWAVIPFAILSILTGKYIKTSIAYWGTAIIINLIIVKRMMLVDSILLMIVILGIILTRKGQSKNFIIIILSFLFLYFFSIFVFGKELMLIFESVLFRTIEVTEDVSNFDRFLEAKNYIESSEIKHLLLGRGFGAKHFSLGNESDALHTGWINFIFKGGMPLFILIIIPYFKIITIFSKLYKAPLKIQFSFWYLLIMLPRLFYLNMHTFSPSMTIFFYCLINIMDYKISGFAGVVNLKNREITCV